MCVFLGDLYVRYLCVSFVYFNVSRSLFSGNPSYKNMIHVDYPNRNLKLEIHKKSNFQFLSLKIKKNVLFVFHLDHISQIV